MSHRYRQYFLLLSQFIYPISKIFNLDFNIYFQSFFFARFPSFLDNNFKMSQIKSYISLDSVPSQQYKTPPRNMIQNMATNNSLIFSNTYGSTDNKSLSNKKTCYQSNTFTKDSNYSPHDYVIQQKDELQNNSSVTLRPKITEAQLSDFICTIKMVNFLTKKHEMGKVLIEKKTKIVSNLKNQVSFLEKKNKIQKLQYEKKQKKVKSRSLSLQKHKKLSSQKMEDEIIKMKLQIRQMKRKISCHVTSQNYKKQNNSHSNKRNNFYPGSQRFRKKIYIPISSNNYYPSGHQTDRISHHSYNNFQQQQLNPFNFGTICSNPQNLPSNKFFPHNYHPNYNLNSGRKSINENSNIKTNQQKINLNGGKNILALIQQKLVGRQNAYEPAFPLSGQVMPQKIPMSNKKSSISSSGKKNQKSDSQRVKINIIKQHQKQTNLDYFGSALDQQDFKDEILMNSQRSRSSIKNLKQSARSITNKWKKDQEDQQIVQLLKKSISDPKQKSQKVNKKGDLRSEIGAKIVVTNIRQQNSLDSVSGIDYLPQMSRQNPIVHQGNSSNVQIIVDMSDQRKNSSRESYKKITNKSIQRNNIINSQIGIILNDNSESHQQSPVKSQTRINSLNKVSVLKEIPAIQEIQDDGGVSTPISLKLTYNLEPSVESQYTETNRSPLTIAKSTSQQSQKQESLPSIPLSRPPSLLEQDQEDDMIESIKLATNSRYSPNSQVTRNEKQVTENQQQDFMNQIRLVGVSRISRQKSGSSSRVKESKQDISSNSSIINQMTQSQLDPKGNILQNTDEMDIIDSQLRRSTNSVIIKKSNSAIQRSTNKQKSNLKQSIQGSELQGKNMPISIPIEQAQEQQQQYSNIIRKHNRNKTDSYK